MPLLAHFQEIYRLGISKIHLVLQEERKTKLLLLKNLYYLVILMFQDIRAEISRLMVSDNTIQLEMEIQNQSRSWTSRS